MPRRRIRPPFAKRRSKIHGLGVFATRRIRAGRILIAYLGQVRTAAEVRALYMDDEADDPHTFLFQLGGGRCVDAGVGGNDARFINHSCDPNCEPELSDGVIWIRAIRNIQPGVELTYDYSLQIEKRASPSRRSRYPCHCGTARCRRTMLASSAAGRPKPRGR
jgi:SET domain-containing protein